MVASAGKIASEAFNSLQHVVRLLDSKRNNQKLLFSAPMKRVIERAEARVKAAQRKLDRIKQAQKELKERETSLALAGGQRL